MFGRSKSELRVELARSYAEQRELRRQIEEAKPKGMCIRCAKLTSYVGEGNALFCTTCESKVQYEDDSKVWRYTSVNI
jgi:hypothetical protein